MPGLIPENILEDILSRINIVELIAEYMPLKRAGRNFRTLCPFHHEKTPSFMVSADRQIFHCFGCGESGNAFKFLMRYDHLEFPEAVEILARKVGINLPQVPQQDPAVVNLSTQLYKINELAEGFYAQVLNSVQGAHAKKYLLSRNISEETIKSFHLGFAPDKWDGLINFLRAKNISLNLIEKSGLVLPKDKGGYYDRFRNRLIFPIRDLKSRILG
ncbi:MAG: CHC2 zinc finger domain-containing protein, partial [Candidatus Omnitrophica bacterium]|nr:CHC2 zinc finger domain-containing protein [Candidatus Omnitrophota bacterium]